MHYPVETYIKALEKMADADPRPYRIFGRSYTALETPGEYAAYLHWFIGYCKGLERAAEMLQGTPVSLYTNWPEHFPKPKEMA